MENYNQGYRSIDFWGKPPIIHSVLRKITAKASHKAKVMLAREKSAIMSGLVKSLDGVHVMMRRERVGKYGCTRNLVTPSPVTIIRTSRKQDGKPKEAERDNATIKTAMFKDVPARTKAVSKKKEYVFRFGEVAIATSI